MTLGLDESMLLLDGLRPPAHMHLAAAVGTTFTLDLAALLAIPVAASMGADLSDTDAVDLLETIRRSSDHTLLFCQAGAIGIPAKYRAALTFVEQSVIEVKKPAGGIFHPKVWAVRFDGDGRTVHRVLVATRNLTFDRAWDAVVRLDENPASEHAADLTGLVDFLAALPALAARQPTPRQQELLNDLLASLGSARLAVPEPFTTATAIPLMPGRRGQPFGRECDSALAVSPFLTADAVTVFTATAARRSIVVSRRASLDSVATALADVDRVLRIKDAVLTAQESIDAVLDDEPPTDEQTTSPVGDIAQVTVPGRAALRGLHAKIYLQDTGEESTMWIGSANLTRPAFQTNLEILLELTGPRHLVGIDSVLDPKGQRLDLSQLVEPHQPSEGNGESPETADGVGELDALAYDLASREITILLTPDGEAWNAELSITPWDPPAAVSVRARPLSLPPGDAVDLTDGTAAWQHLAVAAITPFLVVDLINARTRRSMLVRADLVGDPEGRRGAVLAHAIKTRGDFLRYLAALLGYDAAQLATHPDGTGGFGGWGAGTGSAHLLEDLLTTAARNPERLASLEQTLTHLDADPQTRDLVPADFRTVWQSVYAARKKAIR